MIDIVEKLFSSLTLPEEGSPEPCWIWNGLINEDGSPLIPVYDGSYKTKWISARSALRYMADGVPPELLLRKPSKDKLPRLSPSCGNQKCVSPEHARDDLNGEIRKLSSNNTTGVRGVTWVKKGEYFTAEAMKRGARRRVTRLKTIREAEIQAILLRRDLFEVVPPADAARAKELGI